MKEPITSNYLRDLEGRSKENAISKLNNDEIYYRITVEECVPYMITCDFDMGRVNLEIDLGVVASASLG